MLNCLFFRIFSSVRMKWVWASARYLAFGRTPGHRRLAKCDAGSFVGTSSISLAPPQAAGLGHSVAPPPPTKHSFCGAPFLGLRRFISVALFLRSLWAGVTRYPCPAEPGLSSCAAFRRCARDCPTRSRMYCTLFAGKSQMDCNFFPARI